MCVQSSIVPVTGYTHSTRSPVSVQRLNRETVDMNPIKRMGKMSKVSSFHTGQTATIKHTAPLIPVAVATDTRTGASVVQFLWFRFQ